MKHRVVKKNSFVIGAFITTLGIVISKVLGILYVIPFHAIIGERGGALYGYAYTVYLMFVSLSTAGLPLAISQIVSEYQTLGYYKAKKRAFFLGKRIALILGSVFFFFQIIFARILAQMIVGNISGGNSIDDIAFTIRIISMAVLIVPLLSIYRGYFEGHRFMEAPSISQVIEQLIRITVIILGSFLFLKVFKMSLTNVVGVALFGTFAGALGAYFYLIDKFIGNKKKFDEKIITINEPIVTDKSIIKKLFSYALPFILIDIFKALYNSIDVFTVVKGLVNFTKYNVTDAEAIMGMLSTWCNKFNMIILSVSSGIVVSLIPNLTQSVVKKDIKDVNNKINQALSISFFLMLPMTVGLSFLAKPVWVLFYGDSLYGPSVLSYFIFAGFIMGLFTTIISIMQALKDYKTVLISLAVGVVLKAFLNTNLIVAFYKMGLPPYYGVITATIIGYLTSFIICLLVLKSKWKINYESLVKNFIDIIITTAIMIIVMCILRLLVPISSSTRIINLFIIIFYTVIGCILYFFISLKNGTMKRIFGNKIKKFKL